MNYQNYLKTERWKCIAKIMKKKSDMCCKICGFEMLEHELNLHHKHYDNLFNEQQKDVIVLCESCHKKIHSKNEEIKNKYLDRLEQIEKNGEVIY